jgi:hypothetical protein
MKSDARITALRRFAFAITVLTLLGHTVLEFEQSDIYTLVALAAGYGSDLFLETVSAWSDGRRPRYRGGPVALLNFLLPAHISSLALAMFMYSSDRLWPVVFAVVIAIASKYVFRVSTENGSRHFLNPSNSGIVITLLIFPWVSVATPSQFTHAFNGLWDWLFTALVIVLGTIFNWRLTHRLPLILSWLGAFALQAVLRSWWAGTPVLAALNPMTGFVFYLFTYYMLSDPGTTPWKTRQQVVFGTAVGLTYGLLIMAHMRFTIFFALFCVCAARGLWLWWDARTIQRAPLPEARTPG